MLPVQAHNKTGQSQTGKFVHHGLAIGQWRWLFPNLYLVGKCSAKLGALLWPYCHRVNSEKSVQLGLLNQHFDSFDPTHTTHAHVCRPPYQANQAGRGACEWRDHFRRVGDRVYPRLRINHKNQGVGRSLQLISARLYPCFDLPRHLSFYKNQLALIWHVSKLISCRHAPQTSPLQKTRAAR